MPRKLGSTNAGLKISAVAHYFRTAALEVAEAALELAVDAVKERRNKGKAVLAGRAAGSASTSAAVDKATARATVAPKAVKAKRKPGPAKGTKRKAAARVAVVTDDATDVVDAALPLQDDTLDLDAR